MLRWKKKDKWYIATDDGYKISGAISHGHMRYTAWGPKEQVMAKAILISDKLEYAKAACEEHYEKNQI